MSILRNNEYSIYALNNGNFISVVDTRLLYKLDAALGVGVTLFVCFVLATAALLFTQTTNTLVINPIEEMITKVNRIS